MDDAAEKRQNKPLNCFHAYRCTSPLARQPEWNPCACVFSAVSPLAATALRGLQRGDCPGVAQQVSPVRPGLRRVLPGAGPLLRLGRHRVLQILSHGQEVPTARSHARRRRHPVVGGCFFFSSIFFYETPLDTLHAATTATTNSQLAF